MYYQHISIIVQTSLTSTYNSRSFEFALQFWKCLQNLKWPLPHNNGLIKAFVSISHFSCEPPELLTEAEMCRVFSLWHCRLLALQYSKLPQEVRKVSALNCIILLDRKCVKQAAKVLRQWCVRLTSSICRLSSTVPLTPLNFNLLLNIGSRDNSNSMLPLHNQCDNNQMIFFLVVV